MSKISTWSTTAASNNSTAPDGFPEGMAPSGVNNAARELMAAVRTQHEDAQWIDLGNTPTFATTTTFTVAGDLTTQYDVGRRVKCTDASTLYGTITASSYSSPNTTVTVTLDSGVLSVSLTAVALGILSGQNQSFPGTITTTAIATTSGSTASFSSIPSWVKRITIMMSGFSSNGVIEPQLTLGDSGGIESSGYLGQAVDIAGATRQETTYFLMKYTHSASGTATGIYTLALIDSATNTWVYSGQVYSTQGNASGFVNGEKTLSGVLDRIQISVGTDTFDAGKINILYD